MIRCCGAKQDKAQASAASEADCKKIQGWSQESTRDQKLTTKGRCNSRVDVVDAEIGIKIVK